MRHAGNCHRFRVALENDASFSPARVKALGQDRWDAVERFCPEPGFGLGAGRRFRRRPCIGPERRTAARRSARVPAARLENVLRVTPLYQQSLAELSPGIQGEPVERFAAEPPPSSPAGDGAGLTPSTRLRPPGLLELEELLSEHLDTRVSVQMGAKKGRIGIDFADLEDLERIYRRMSGA
jgi:hypothetical protein